MSKVTIVGNGGGGTNSDDVTAYKSHLLKGYRTITADSNDEIVEGLIPNCGSAKAANDIGLNANGLFYHIAKGYYHEGDRLPWVYAPLTSIRNVFGLVASKIANGVTLAGVTGTYKGLGNAGTGDVMAGKKFSTASLSNATGTIVDRGSVSHSLPINGSYTIPAGRHSGSGRVTQSIPVQGAQTITPGTSNKSIASGRYLSGMQTIAGDRNLVANNIKKGVPLFGVVGTWEGYVPGVNDIYNNGANNGLVSEYDDYTKFESNVIWINGAVVGSMFLYFAKAVNLTPYTYLKIEVSSAESYDLQENTFELIESSLGILARVNVFIAAGRRSTCAINVSEINMTKTWSIGLPNDRHQGCFYIHRVWFE